MKTDDKSPVEQGHLGEGMRHIFSQDSPPTTRSSRSSSRSSSSSSDGSYSSGDRSRSRRRRRHGSRYSSSSSSSSSSGSSRSRSRPRCCRASGRSRCRHRHRSRSSSPYSRRPSRYMRRRYSRSLSRSSSRERYYRRSRRSRSRSSSYSRARVDNRGRFRCRFSPSPVRRSYRPRSKSPQRSIRLSQRDKMELLNIAKENAAKILGVEVVKLPSSVKTLATDTEKWVRAEPVPLEITQHDKSDLGEDVEISKTSPVRKPISFSVGNAVAKPSSSPTLHVPESKVTSRADSVGNRLPYGQWIPVKTVSLKRR